MGTQHKIEETSLVDFSKMQVASPTTVKYAQMRRSSMRKGVPDDTKLIQSKINTSDDSITFYFLVEATGSTTNSEGYYDDDHVYRDTNPDMGFALERNPSELYEVTVKFFGISKLASNPNLDLKFVKER
jgi:hypothetical protein